jgi:hypothetical protein
MSTNNFAFHNILIAVEDAEAEMIEEFPIPQLKEELQGKFKEGYESDEYMNDGLSRSYGGKEIFRIPVTTNQGETYRMIIVYYRGGYYGGANIDYYVSQDGYYAEPKGTKTLDKEIASQSKKIEKILRKYGTELTKVANFSNGEAVYKVKQ